MENRPMAFVADSKQPTVAPENALWFLVHDNRILIKEKQDNYLIPQSSDIKKLGLAPEKKQFFGLLDGKPCYVAELGDGADVSSAFSFVGLRALFSQFGEDVIRAAGMASQLLRWGQNHRYCGRCGERTENKRDERAKICPQCGLVNYPRLSPAMIVAVLKDRKILLAHSKRFPGKFFSVLAGFVEPGETLEECVKREVSEEVGITVRNIRYFGSQPWPFPDSLMVAFTAEYAAGEIEIDHSEIAEAGWYSAKQLPSIPPKISIARELIDWFSEKEG
jgi:NAD+ diphosphatase